MKIQVITTVFVQKRLKFGNMSAGYPMPDNMHYPDDEEYGVTKKHNPDLTDAAWDKRWKGADEVKRKEIVKKYSFIF